MVEGGMRMCHVKSKRVDDEKESASLRNEKSE